ncbi:hypothetical protein KA107_03470 [Candidatus Pacearchaeota archaeon]|nr:hypothetical protein [Candidatus Pacearchaeota archaeon]
MADFQYDEFLICSIQNANEGDREYLENYVSTQAAKGIKVYYPAIHTDQLDVETGGYRICSDNLDAITKANIISIYWTEKSRGSVFDLGIAFHEHKHKGKKIKLINREQVEAIVARQKAANTKKSLEMILLKLDSM